MSKQITTMDDYQRVIALSRYSRWDQETGRRETWEETVERAITWLAGYVSKKTGDKPSTRTVNTLIAAVKAMDVMPSMRLLHFAGEAMDKNHIRLFNCTALRFDDLAAFGETVYLAMSGAGVGGRITKDQINKLPAVPATFQQDHAAYVIADSVRGWAEAVDYHIRSLIEEATLSAFDYSLIRPKGARLVTSGGFAPGPAPLKELIDKITEIVTAAQGRKLRTIEVHDIFTMIGSIVVAGGARRSALISLFSPNDKSMMDAKKDNWWDRHPNFAYANNSASFMGRPPMNEFFEFWHDVFKSGSGEPGFANAQAAISQSRRFDRPISSDALLGNPCLEIYSFESTFMCNLTNITVRPDDDIKSLKRKAGQAATLGYWQALVTDFKYLRPEWKENAEKEMLLGVSMSGICDHAVLSTPSHKSSEWLQELRSHVKNTADRWATKFDTKKTVAWTAVKPSGNCVPENTLVTTDQGILSAWEIAADNGALEQGQWTHVQGLSSRTSGDIKKVVRQGVQPLMKLTLKYGMEFEATAAHRIMVNGEWRKMRDVQEGDKVEIKLGEYQSTKDADLKPFQYENVPQRYKAPIRAILPTTVDTDLSWLLGYMWGDGSMSHNGHRIRFSDSVLSNLKKAQRIMKGYGYNLKISDRTANFSFSAECAAKHMWFWLQINGLYKYEDSTNKQIADIPKVIRSSSKECVIAFISGLIDADASVSNGVNFATNQDRLSTHFQGVASACGLLFGHSLNTRGKSFAQEGRKHMWLMRLSPYSQQDSLDMLVKHSTRIEELNQSHHLVDSFERKLGTVMKVESIKEAQTWDIETQTKAFVAGALLSHNSGELVNASSGIHPRFSRHYVRRIQQNADDPISKFLIEQGVPHETSEYAANTLVFSFPRKAPETSLTANDMSALDQCKLWLHYKSHYAVHTISCTVYVRDHEWMEVGAWVYENFDDLIGISFLPYTDHSYKQAPYTAVTATEYNRLMKEMPTLDWGSFTEESDTTNVTDQVECTGAACDMKF